MAKIIYKEGMEGQNNLSSIEGIEIELRCGQHALIYPKYKMCELLKGRLSHDWILPLFEKGTHSSPPVADADDYCEALSRSGSPAANFVHQFASEDHGIFRLPTIYAAEEIMKQKGEINSLAEQIADAEVLTPYHSPAWTVVLYSEGFCQTVGRSGHFITAHCNNPYLAIPTIVY